MSEAGCKVHVVAGGMNFEISGPEAFVRETVELFKDQLKSCFELRRTTPSQETTGETPAEPPAAPHVKGPGSLPEFPNVLHFENNDVKVLKTKSGNTKSKKAVNTALIYLWGKRELGVDSVPTTDVREICKLHSCLDENNFSANIKTAREWIILEDKMMKLTVPGVGQAERLLAELNGADGK